MMPGESGIELLNHIRSQYPELPIVMVSGIGDPTFAAGALDLGAYGYVTKPFEANQVLIAVANALRRARLESENSAYRAHLEEMVRERTADLAAALARVQNSEEQLRLSSEDTVQALSRAIEGRDVETGQHIERMSRYAELLAHEYGLSTDDCQLIRLASPMHDVGKIGVPDGILFKPGKLSTSEFDVIKQHPELGYEILAKSEQPLLAMAAVIARSHHERWDGTGYPQGLSSNGIALEARIAAVADVFDALVSRRVYKPAFPLDRSLRIMEEGRGTQFDPDVVDLLLVNIDKVVAIQEQYRDE
jgi:putative two-component system response regulator